MMGGEPHSKVPVEAKLKCTFGYQMTSYVKEMGVSRKKIVVFMARTVEVQLWEEVGRDYQFTGDEVTG